jgi:DNA-binding IclR family transcriptional regulator
MNEVKALAKGLLILDQLLETHLRPEDQRRIAVSEVAGILQVNKSSASRLLQTLSNYGYVARDGESRAYVLGPKMQSARQSGSKTVFRDLARPFLYQLMKLSGECAHTAIVAQGQALLIDDVESASSLRVSGGIGRIEELHCTAVGKCLLAFMDLTVPRELKQHTPQTICNHSEFKRHLEEIRQQGYALDDEENIEGVRCIAAPVYDQSGSAVACIGISGPTVRMTTEAIPRYINLVLETSKELSHSLGFRDKVAA